MQKNTGFGSLSSKSRNLKTSGSEPFHQATVLFSRAQVPLMVFSSVVSRKEINWGFLWLVKAASLALLATSVLTSFFYIFVQFFRPMVGEQELPEALPEK